MDPLAEEPHNLSVTPYHYVTNNPMLFIDPNGEDWYDVNGNIAWHDQEGELKIDDQIYQSLGKNVLVGTHNRDENGNEEINSAIFSLYLESNTEEATATIEGNSVPADVNSMGTLAEGLYQAKSDHRSKHPKESALRILNLDGTDGLLTVNGNPNPKSDGQTLTGVFFHSASDSYESLFSYNADGSVGKPWTTGCQTSGSGPGRRALHNAFMNKVGNFNGTYYLRGKK